jgi:hypothetical protein
MKLEIKIKKNEREERIASVAKIILIVRREYARTFRKIAGYYHSNYAPSSHGSGGDGRTNCKLKTIQSSLSNFLHPDWNT